MDNSQDVVFELDIRRATLTLYQSGPWAGFFGYAAGREYPYEAMVRAMADSFIDRDDKDAFLRAANLQAIRKAFSARAPLICIDVRIKTPSSAEYQWYHITLIAPIEGKSNGTIQNVQAEKEAAEKLRHQAEREPLTDLLNRGAFDRAVAAQFARGLKAGAFLIFDIDDFKLVNDTRGHQYGDTIIVEMAQWLRRVMPEDALIARFGGDEFTVFLPTATDMAVFRKRVRALCLAFGDAADTRKADFTVSIGASFFPMDGGTASVLLRCADRALYHVKHNGKNGYAFFEAFMPASFEQAERVEPKRTPVSGSTAWRRRLPVAALLLATVIVLALLSRAYLTGLRKMIREESLDYLNEIAMQIDISTVKTLESYSARMEIIGSDLNTLSPAMDMKGLCLFLQGKCLSIGCESIAAVDENSLWHTPDRESKFIELNNELAVCVYEQRTLMSESVIVDGLEYVLIFTPVQLTTTDGISVCAIAAFLRFDVLNDVLSLSAFHGAGHADILTLDGRVVLRSGHENCILEGYNLFSVLRDKEFTDETGYRGMHAAFTAGETGSSRIIFYDRENIFHYSKLHYQDWMLLTTVPADVLESRSQAFMRTTLFACMGIAVIFCSLMAALMLMQANSKTKLERLAYVDRITGSATPEKFKLDAQRLLARKESAYAMVYTNVDRFKVVNDRLGTDGANDLLRYIAQVIQNALRDNEAAGRIDADHFGVLLNTREEGELRQRIREWDYLISQYPQATQASLALSSSYGVYVIDDPTLPIDLLLDRSNLARSAQLKESDSMPRIYFYNDALRKRLLREQVISDQMEQALTAGHFHMYLQPKYACADETLVGYEALVRWKTQEHGLMLPGSFIPILERNGFIVKLDLYIFEQVCKTLRGLLDAGQHVPRISFNVSRVHLNAEDLLAPYLAIWEKYPVPPDRLEFEFTETVIGDNPRRLRRVIEEIHAYGFRCAMDDFGAGYSSLNMLHATNVDTVKIDRSFLGERAVPTDRSKAILRAVISLARELGMSTVAEGVEYAQQAAFLRESGCDAIQGFFYAKPMPAEEALALYRPGGKA